MKIGRREVGPGQRTFIIAEAGNGHAGDLVRALTIIDECAKRGADAVKFQMFRTERLYGEAAPDELYGRDIRALLRKLEMPLTWLPLLAERCESREVEFMCTAFDFDSLDAVDPFVNVHKIGSAEHTWSPFVLRVLAKGKPTIISMGAGDEADGDGSSWPKQAILLHCVSAYPAPLADVNLRAHPKHVWGLSDHTTNPTIAPCAAVSLGACVIEKHVKLNGFEPDDPDWRTAVTLDGFADMVDAIRQTEIVLGSDKRAVRESERPVVALRRGPLGLRGA